MPDVYTHGHHESVLRSHTWRTVANSAAYLAGSLRPGMSLLDVGCGPGTLTIDLARHVLPGRVVGVDAASGVLEGARARAAEAGVDVEFVVGDVYRLDAPDDSFDVVHAHQVLQHLTRPIDALREFRRVARPDGLVAARDVDYEGAIWYPRLPGLDEWREVYLAVHRAVSGDPSAGRQLKAWARAAGFEEVTSTADVWLFETDVDRAWWGEAWAERALASSFAEHAVALGLADHAALERIAAGWRQWADDPDGWLLMPHAAIIARG